MPEAARKLDTSLCKATQKPGTGHFVLATGEVAQVMIENGWAVCETDAYLCDGANSPFFAPTPCATGMVKKGSSTVLIGNKPAARKTDPTQCAGTGAAGNIMTGAATVLIGDMAGGGGGGAGNQGGAGGTEASSVSARKNSSGTASDTQSELADAPPGESEKQVGNGTHWIEIELVDEAEQPVVGERYELRLPNQREVNGALDGHGKVRVVGIKEPGPCAVRFPDLDVEAWSRYGPATPTTASLVVAHRETGTETAPVEEGNQARGGKWHTVLQGECVASLARAAGLTWKTIWNHASNSDLRSNRANANILLPGDHVFVPARRPREEPAQIDQKNKFRRRGEPSSINLRVLDVAGRPRAGEPFQLQIGSEHYESTTDGDGRVRVAIDARARSGRLIVGEAPNQDTHELWFGALDPMHSVSGLQGRLENLGLDPGPCDGILGPRTCAAIVAFQRRENLEQTGEFDAATREKLFERHGS